MRENEWTEGTLYWFEDEVIRLKEELGEALVRENNLLAENARLKFALGPAVSWADEMNKKEAENAKLRTALEQLRKWCADKGDLDGELMAEAALSNEQKIE